MESVWIACGQVTHGTERAYRRVATRFAGADGTNSDVILVYNPGGHLVDV